MPTWGWYVLIFLIVAMMIPVNIAVFKYLLEIWKSYKEGNGK